MSCPFAEEMSKFQVREIQGQSQVQIKWFPHRTIYRDLWTLWLCLPKDGSNFSTRCREVERDNSVGGMSDVIWIPQQQLPRAPGLST